MGGCTSKPMVLEDDFAAEAPEPAPKENVELLREEIFESYPVVDVEEETKEVTESSPVASPVVVEEEIEIEVPEFQLVEEEDEDVVTIVEVAEVVKEVNEEEKYSSEMDTKTAPNPSERVARMEEPGTGESEIKSTANLVMLEADHEANSSVATPEKKQEEQPQGQNNLVVSFISSLMGQQKRRS